MKLLRANQIIIATILLCVCFVPSLSFAWGYIEGFVRDEAGQPIVGAKVETAFGSINTWTDGSYLMALPPGTNSFRATASGFTPFIYDNITIVDNISSSLSFTLSKAPLNIETVYPNQGKLGEDLDVIIRGTGFDNSTRMSMAFDSGNKANIVAQVDTPGEARNVFIYENKAYVADGPNGLQIIDIDPASPTSETIINSIEIPGQATSLFIDNNIAFIVSGDPSDSSSFDVLHLIDINSNSSNYLGFIDSFAIPLGVRDIAFFDNCVYVVGGSTDIMGVGLGTIFKIDIDPSSPTYFNSYPYHIQASTQLSGPNGITIFNGIAYVATGDTLANVGLLELFSISPSGIYPLALVDIPYGYFANDVFVNNNIAYVAAGPGNLFSDSEVGAVILIDIDPTSPTYLSVINTLKTLGSSENITVSGSYLYISGGASGIQVFNLDDPENPVHINSTKTTGKAFSLAIENSKAYVASGFSGLEVIDISNLELQMPIDLLHLDYYGKEVKILDDKAYVAAGIYDGISRGALLIINTDVSSPNYLNIINSVELGNHEATSLFINNNIAYIATKSLGIQNEPEEGGLWLVNLDENSPQYLSIITSIKLESSATKVVVANNIAYVLSEVSMMFDVFDGDILAVDVNPNSLNYSTIIASNRLYEGGNDLKIVDDIVYVGCGGHSFDGYIWGSLKIFDGDPTSPNFLSMLHDIQMPNYFSQSGVEVNKIEIKNNIAYVATAGNDPFSSSTWGGLVVIDVDQASQNFRNIISHFDVNSETSDLIVIEDKAYLTNKYYGLSIIDISDLLNPTLIASLSTVSRSYDVSIVDDIVYFSDYISAFVAYPLPIEIKPLNIFNNTEIFAKIPSPKLKGHYSIRVFNSSHSNELLGALTFSDQMAQSKAIIVAGYGPHSSNWLWSETQRNANYAYNALLWQGYRKENIQYLSSVPVDVDGNGKFDDVDGDANIANLEKAITVWAKNADDLILYMVDHGGDKTFKIKHTDSVQEVLPAESLAGWLNTLQNTMTGRAIFINESCYSGSFLEPFRNPPGKDYDRVILTSSAADEKSKLLRDGRLSFSYQFWSVIHEGAQLAPAFNHGRDMMITQQNAWLDANGDAVPNNFDDIISNITIGRGYKSAAGAPTIASVTTSQALAGSTSKLLWVETGPALNPITQVWAVVMPPDYDSSAPETAEVELPSVELAYSQTNRRYEGTYNDFTINGTYQISFYAMDNTEAVSLPETTIITQTGGLDIYEDDDDYTQANVIYVDNGTVQHHMISKPGDRDWIKFYAFAGQTYHIQAFNLGASSNPVIELYDTDGTTLLHDRDTIGDPTAEETLLWEDCTQEGIYYALVRHADPKAFGIGTEYDLGFFRPDFPINGTIKGTITDIHTGIPVQGAIAKLRFGASLSSVDGKYKIVHEAGEYPLTVSADCHITQKVTPDPEVFEGQETTENIALFPDSNCGNISPTANAGADQTVFGEITLDGTLSIDLNGDAITYDWQIVHQTDSANNQSSTEESPVLTGLQPGFYEVTLTVTDTGGLNGTDTMSFTATGAAVTQEDHDRVVAEKDEVLAGKDQTISALTGTIADQTTKIDNLATIRAYYLYGDYNADGDVDAADLSRFSENYGLTGIDIFNDADSDNYTEYQGDCNDDNINIHPDASEICSDQIDNNCNGQVDEQPCVE